MCNYSFKTINLNYNDGYLWVVTLLKMLTYKISSGNLHHLFNQKKEKKQICVE